MKNPENGENLEGFETIRVFLIFIWKEQNCSFGERKGKKNYDTMNNWVATIPML